MYASIYLCMGQRLSSHLRKWCIAKDGRDAEQVDAWVVGSEQDSNDVLELGFSIWGQEKEGVGVVLAAWFCIEHQDWFPRPISPRAHYPCQIQKRKSKRKRNLGIKTEARLDA